MITIYQHANAQLKNYNLMNLKNSFTSRSYRCEVKNSYVNFYRQNIDNTITVSVFLIPKNNQEYTWYLESYNTNLLNPKLALNDFKQAFNWIDITFSQNEFNINLINQCLKEFFMKWYDIDYSMLQTNTNDINSNTISAYNLKIKELFTKYEAKVVNNYHFNKEMYEELLHQIFATDLKSFHDFSRLYSTFSVSYNPALKLYWSLYNEITESFMQNFSFFYELLNLDFKNQVQILTTARINHFNHTTKKEYLMPTKAYNELISTNSINDNNTAYLSKNEFISSLKTALLSSRIGSIINQKINWNLTSNQIYYDILAQLIPLNYYGYVFKLNSVKQITLTVFEKNQFDISLYENEITNSKNQIDFFHANLAYLKQKKPNLAIHTIYNDTEMFATSLIKSFLIVVPNLFRGQSFSETNSIQSILKFCLDGLKYYLPQCQKYLLMLKNNAVTLKIYKADELDEYEVDKMQYSSNINDFNQLYHKVKTYLSTAMNDYNLKPNIFNPMNF